ncbi:MAG: MFS transporter [Cyclobacteriaceae bacterium]
MEKKETIFTLQFALLCLSGFLFFGSFNMLIPELPSYLDAMGGGEYKGLIIALFTVTAGLSRPFSGKLADKVGRIPVMVVGALVSGIAALLYPIVSGVIGFFALRFFHGFSTGFKPTGTSAYVADLVPAGRRGEAMGIVGFFSSLGMAAGPAIGAFLASQFSLNMMFYSSSAFAILSVAILVGMKETLKTPERLKVEHFVIKKGELYEPRVLTPSLMMLLSVFSFGTVLTVIPDFSDHLNVANRGLFFTYFTTASLLVRILAGKASDKFGRVPVLKVGSISLIASMLLLANTESQTTFMISAFLFGFGVGICSPTIFAWTIDLSDDKHRGRGIATMYIALEIGIGLGAFISGWIFGNDLSNLYLVFYMSASLVLIGFLYLFTSHVRNMTLSTEIQQTP